MWNTEDNLRKIGSKLGEVIEIDLIVEPGSVWKKFVRIRVDIPLRKPLIPSLFLPRPNNTNSWIGLKYEKLIDVYYKCGFVGHEETSCIGTLFQLCPMVPGSKLPDHGSNLGMKTYHLGFLSSLTMPPTWP